MKEILFPISKELIIQIPLISELQKFLQFHNLIRTNFLFLPQKTKKEYLTKEYVVFMCEIVPPKVLFICPENLKLNFTLEPLPEDLLDITVG